MIQYDIIDNLSSLDERWVAEHLKQLPAQRREKVEKINHLAGRRESIAAYELLERLVSECFGLTTLPDFEFSAHGKPSLKGHPEIHFNISHCREAVLVAVGNEPVGVDVETYGRYKPALAEHVLNEAELNDLEKSLSKDRDFTEIWTIKEAILKFTGEGVSGNMKNVVDEHPDLTFAIISTDKYSAAIATAKH